MFRGSCWRETTRSDHVDFAGNKVGGQSGQPIITALRPSVFDRHALSFDPAGFAQSLTERSQDRYSLARRPDVEKADHRNRLLLCSKRVRRSQCAAQQEHQLAASH